MGISKPRLYLAFGNKAELFARALERYRREQSAYIFDAIGAPTARKVAERMLRRALEMQRAAHDAQHRFASQSEVAAAETQPLLELRKAQKEVSESALSARFSKADDFREVSQEIPPRAIARYLIAVVQGLESRRACGADDQELQEIVDVVLRLWPGS